MFHSLKIFEISKMIELFTGSTTAEVAKHHEQSEATPGGGQAQVRPSTVSRTNYYFPVKSISRKFS